MRAEIPNSDLKLIPGSTFSISVQLPGQDAPVVPALAIEWDRQGAFVWRVSEANTVERVNVAILGRDGDLVNLDAKLNANDKVVSRGWQFAARRPDCETAELLKSSSFRRAEPRWTIH